MRRDEVESDSCRKKQLKFPKNNNVKNQKNNRRKEIKQYASREDEAGKQEKRP